MVNNGHCNGTPTGAAERNYDKCHCRTAVLPSIEALARLQSEDKIRGGVVAGARTGAFVLEADSHDEATEILMGLPNWGFSKVEFDPAAEL